MLLVLLLVQASAWTKSISNVFALFEIYLNHEGKSIIESIHETYGILYQKGLNTSQAIEFIGQKMSDCEERTSIFHFIKWSTRGIIKR